MEPKTLSISGPMLYVGGLILAILGIKLAFEGFKFVKEKVAPLVLTMVGFAIVGCSAWLSRFGKKEDSSPPRQSQFAPANARTRSQ